MPRRHKRARQLAKNAGKARESLFKPGSQPQVEKYRLPEKKLYPSSLVQVQLMILMRMILPLILMMK